MRHDEWTGSSGKMSSISPRHMAAHCDIPARGRPPAWAAILSRSLVTQNPSYKGIGLVSEFGVSCVFLAVLILYMEGISKDGKWRSSQEDGNLNI